MDLDFKVTDNPNAQERDVKMIIFKLIKSWPFLAAGAIIGLAIAFSVNRFSKNQYELSTLLSIEENTESFIFSRKYHIIQLE